MTADTYTRDQVIRDIVYFYYLCEQNRALPTGGAMFGVALDGPYHTFFVGDANDDPSDAEDRLIREGSLLIFLGMLDAQDARDNRITYPGEEALELLAHSEMSGHWTRELATVDPHLWGRVRTIVLERGLTLPATRLAQRNLYGRFAGKFFAERCT